MKKLVLIFALAVNSAFGNTNSWTNSWSKLTYDPNARADRMMCPKCGFSCPVRPGRWIKVGKSQIKCTNFKRGKFCNEKMWYVDMWMSLNFSHKRLRECALRAQKYADDAIDRGDEKSAREWVEHLKNVRDELKKVVELKLKYLDSLERAR